MIKQLSKISAFTILIILGLSLNIYSDDSLDSDNDGMPDSWETTYGLNPSINDTDNDADNDGLINIEEFNYNTFPNNPDTDNDGLTDYEEVSDNISEFQVNTYTQYNQQQQGIASNSNSYLVIWESKSQDGSGYGVYGQLYDSSGNKTGSEFQINTYTTSHQENPRAATDGTNYFVTWVDATQDGSSHGIYGQLFDLSGNKIGSEFQINTYTTNEQLFPTISINGTNYFVTWMSSGQDGSSYGIYGQLFDLNGNKTGSEFQINTYTNNDQRYLEVASDGNNFFVTWMSLTFPH